MAEQSPPPSAAPGPRFPPDPDPELDSTSPPSLVDDSSSSSASSSFRSRTPAIHHLSFNQDYTRFAAGLDDGFSVYISDPFHLSFRRASDSRCCGVGLVAMLYHSDTFCFVGGGPSPVYATHKVMIFDDHESRFSGELSFPSEVKNVKYRPDRIAVVLAHRILVFNFADLKVVWQIETVENPKGLCEISSSSPLMVLACPGVQKGQIRVGYGSSRSRVFMAHDSKLACLAMTADGRLLASACEKGTLIRIFNTLDGQLLQEVRRGSERAEIYSLAFSPRANWLALSSDKGTVHVFTLKIYFSNDRSLKVFDPSCGISCLSFCNGVLPKCFSSERSVARYRLPKGLQHSVGFGSRNNTIVIIGMDGSFYRCEFDPAVGREMTLLERHNILQTDRTRVNFL